MEQEPTDESDDGLIVPDVHVPIEGQPLQPPTRDVTTGKGHQLDGTLAKSENSPNDIQEALGSLNQGHSAETGQEQTLGPNSPELETLDVQISAPSASLLFTKLLKLEAGDDPQRQATIDSLRANLTQALEAAGARLNPRTGRMFEGSAQVLSHGEVSLRLSEDEANLVREIIDPVMSNPESTVSKRAFTRISDQLNPQESIKP